MSGVVLVLPIYAFTDRRGTKSKVPLLLTGSQYVSVSSPWSRIQLCYSLDNANQIHRTHVSHTFLQLLRSLGWVSVYIMTTF